MEDRSGIASSVESVIHDAAVVQANHHQFAAGDEVGYDRVSSRALIWCIAGRGEIESRNRTFALPPGSLLVLPWGHDVRYRPDPSDPFLLGTVHVIPDHDRGVAITALPRYGSARLPYRRDALWPGFEEPRAFRGSAAATVIRIGEVAVEQLPEWECDEVVMRALGVLLARATIRLARVAPPDERLPVSLIRMQEYARSHLYAPLTTTVLADVARCSVSTAERQFRRYTGTSPMTWVKEERLQLAARLLRTSNRRVGEVSAIAGFRDSFYFARVFRGRFGASPRNFSRRYPTRVGDL